MHYDTGTWQFIAIGKSSVLWLVNKLIQRWGDTLLRAENIPQSLNSQVQASI